MSLILATFVLPATIASWEIRLMCAILPSSLERNLREVFCHFNQLCCGLPQLRKLRLRVRQKWWCRSKLLFHCIQPLCGFLNVALTTPHFASNSVRCAGQLDKNPCKQTLPHLLDLFQRGWKTVDFRTSTPYRPARTDSNVVAVPRLPQSSFGVPTRRVPDVFTTTGFGFGC